MARDFPIALVSLWVPPPPGIVPDDCSHHYDDDDNSRNVDDEDECDTSLPTLLFLNNNHPH